MADTRNGRPIRALLIAEQANPEWVSVPLEGWSHSRAIAQRVDIDAHVVTQVRNREAFLRAGMVEGEDFTAIDSEKIAKPLYNLANKLRGGKGVGWTMIMAATALSYPYFERQVWATFGDDLRAGKYDLVHRITPLSPTVNSSLAKRCKSIGVPFVMGPLNGGVPWPKEYDHVRRAEREWLSYVRPLHRLLPGHGATFRNATAVIAGSTDTHRLMPASTHGKLVYIPENAVDPARFPDLDRSADAIDEPADRFAGDPLRIIFVGRMVPYKGPDVLLEAAADLIRDGRVELTYAGDGPLFDGLKRYAEDHGLGAGVRLLGRVPHEQLGEELKRSAVFAFPSIREFGGAVVLEAMAMGVVPLVVGYGGPAELVTESTGYAVPMDTREALVRAFADRLAALAADPSELQAMSVAGRSRVATHFTWAAKARQVAEVYRWATGRRDDRPDYDMPLHDTSSASHRPDAEVPRAARMMA
ncbi:MAG: glycosyltransferase family 4 protein [Planctomycetota bacterium]